MTWTQEVIARRRQAEQDAQPPGFFSLLTGNRFSAEAPASPNSLKEDPVPGNGVLTPTAAGGKSQTEESPAVTVEGVDTPYEAKQYQLYADMLTGALCCGHTRPAPKVEPTLGDRREVTTTTPRDSDDDEILQKVTEVTMSPESVMT